MKKEIVELDPETMTEEEPVAVEVRYTLPGPAGGRRVDAISAETAAELQAAISADVRTLEQAGAYDIALDPAARRAGYTL